MPNSIDNVPFVSLVAGVARLRWCLRLIESTKSGDSGYDSVNRISPFLLRYEIRVPESSPEIWSQRLEFRVAGHDAAGTRCSRSRQLGGVVLRLPDVFCQCFIPCLRFDRGQLRVAILQNLVSLQRLAPPPVAFDASERNRVFATNAADTSNTPGCRSEGGINVFGSGFGFVHGKGTQSFVSRITSPISLG